MGRIFSSRGIIHSITCVSSDLTAPGTSSLSEEAGSGSIVFVDPDNWDFRLSSNDTIAKGAGKDLSADPEYSFTTDIGDNTRTVPWDIGASNFISQAVSIALKFALKTVNKVIIKGQNFFGKAKS